MKVAIQRRWVLIFLPFFKVSRSPWPCNLSLSLSNFFSIKKWPIVLHCHTVVLHCSMKRIGLEIEGTYIGDTTQSLLLSLVNENWPEHVFDRMGERRDLEKKGNPIYFPLVSFVPSHHSPFIFVKEQQFSLKRNIASFFWFQLNSTVWFFTVLSGYNFEREL